MEIAYENEDRFAILKAVVDRGIRSGDVLFRRSDAKGPLGLPFMRLVARATKSDFTHAAVAFWEFETLYVLEITDIGTMKYRFIDWLCFCIDGKLAVYTCDELEPEGRDAMETDIDQILRLDPSYDYTFSNPMKYYCTEAVSWLYRWRGISLCQPLTASKILSAFDFALLKLGSMAMAKLTGGKVSFPTDEPMYFVGNETNGGLMASPHLRCIYKL